MTSSMPFGNVTQLIEILSPIPVPAAELPRATIHLHRPSAKVRNFVRQVRRISFTHGGPQCSREGAAQIGRFHFAIKARRLCSSEVVLELRDARSGRGGERNIIYISVVLRLVSGGREHC